jgi:hypothetical protein
MEGPDALIDLQVPCMSFKAPRVILRSSFNNCDRACKMMLNQEQIQQVWENGISVPNFDPRLFRKDSFGAWICRSSYDSEETQLSLGWTAINSATTDQGGVHDATDLKPIQWENTFQIDTNPALPPVTACGLINAYHDKKPEI